VAVVYLGTQFLGIVLVGVLDALRHPGLDMAEWGRRAGEDGFVLSMSVCLSAIVTIPVVYFLIQTAEPWPWSFLGFRRVPLRGVLLSCGAVLAYVAIADSFSIVIGRSPVAPFMLSIHETARSVALLAFVLVILVPFFEEILFRGFLFGGLRASGAPAWAAALVVSVIFGALHTQYDAYDTTGVFLTGVLLVAARMKFDSIVPSIAMHGVANAIGLIEVIWIRAHSG